MASLWPPMRAAQGSSRRLLLARAWTGLLVLAVGTIAASADAPEGTGEPREAGLEQIESLIVASFEKADADRLATAFSRRVKTYVAYSPLADADGYYGADQMRLLLRRMFRGRETVRFRILEPATRRRPDGLAVLTAVWAFRQASAPVTQARLSFGLGPEGGSWRVREIRDLK
jgi:hypothetical protein